MGQDCPSLLRQLETKYGKKDVRTRLRWSICGPWEKVTNIRSVQLIYSPLNKTTHIDFTLKKFWEIEKVPEDMPSNRKLSDIQEKTQRACMQVGNRY